MYQQIIHPIYFLREISESSNLLAKLNFVNNYIELSGHKTF